MPNPEPNTFNGIGGVCERGHYCPEGTSHFRNNPCPIGTFLNSTHQTKLSDCVDCRLGSYCADEGLALPSGLCYGGFFCLRRSSTPTPDGSIASQGAPCPSGHFCPNGTSTPIGCRAGTYNPNEGEAECFECPQGYYCLENSTTYNNTVCPAGHYCPSGTRFQNEYPCLPGTFLGDTGATSQDDCTPCSPGQYCPYAGMQAPAGPCSAGWYCRRGSWSENPIDLGNLTTPDSCYCTNTSVGDRCQPGFYCPTGSAEPIECNLGRYCDNPGLSLPTGLCSPGYYCLRGAKRPNPVDGVTGNVCTPGHYCPEGTFDPVPCPSGTFSNATLLSSRVQCRNCTAGEYCSGVGLTSPNGKCSAGFYCPGGQATSTPTEYVCQRGYFCPEGSVSPLPCLGGTYQNATGQEECLPCPSGYYCDSADSPLIDFSSFVCPRGYYCPEGTAQENDYPCPSGTYGRFTGLGDVSECTPCSPRRYCEEPGRTSAGLFCSAGYFCVLGANSSTPTDGTTGDECPPGHHCVQGTSVPSDCPRGTYAATGGRISAADCTDCDAGKFCNGTGLIEPTDLCSPGFYCDGGADTPTQRDCPQGNFCPRGSTSPTPCLGGTYMLSTKASTCDVCPEGFYCTPQTGIDPVVCPAGFYCPLGTGFDWRGCPPGTYGNDVGLVSASNCTQCDGGEYCDSFNATAPTGFCTAGYFCTIGSDSPTPDEGFSGTAGPCPAGFYCEVGSIVPTPCPEGTFSNTTHLEGSSECTSCLDGRYCEARNLTEPSGPCDKGFFCNRGAKVPNPRGNDDTGGPCPEGAFCPAGTSVPLGCPAGTYNNLKQQSTCFSCPAGYYCLENTTDFTLVCPEGFYCPNGTRHPYEYPCPKGTYNPVLQSTNVDDCLPCPPGEYCESDGLARSTGLCAEGWYCVRGAFSNKPTLIDGVVSGSSCFCSNASNGGQCAPGSYCPLGSNEPIPCDPGHYCNASGLSNVTGPCSAGYFCTQNATSPKPSDGTTGNVCPPGHYCLEGTSSPIQCPIGTFSNSTGNDEEADCAKCSAGFYCPVQGLTAPYEQCGGGYFCPPGQSSSTPVDFRCSPGHSCPPGSSVERPCPSGTYQNEFGQVECKECPAGFYCDGTLLNATQCDHGVSFPVLCPPGYYCPRGTEYSLQYACPNGTFNSRYGIRNESECSPCRPGKYCGDVGLASPSGNCSAGFYCILGAKTSKPTDKTTGDICPTGHYCVEGSQTFKPCEPGFFSPNRGLRAKAECLPCTGGNYCHAYGLNETSGNCSARYFCSEKATTPTPTDGATGDECPVGHFCPAGSAAPLPCNDGTYTNQTLSSDCLLCPIGFYCIDASSLPLSCPAGFFCPSGTGHDWMPCPSGSFSPQSGISDVSQCLSCSAGKYCQLANATEETGFCEAGFFCIDGSDSPTPDGITSKGISGVCPVGAYCPRGTGQSNSCPRGTFSNATGLKNVSQCVDCPYGYYCDGDGLTEPSGKCDPGFYCVLRSDVKNPGSATAIGGPCPPGHFCPEGSSSPQQCEAGTYNLYSKSASCEICPNGYYCPNRSITFEDTDCPKGHYCPAGTRFATEYPCPEGTYLNYTNANRSTQCKPCSPGKYCSQAGTPEPDGNCAPGYYCTRGSHTPTPKKVGNETRSECVCPINEGVGGKCLKGTYCPSGSDYPIDCPPGYYCGNDSLAYFSGPCLAGYYCSGRATVANPVDNTTGGACPSGHYCPLASEYPQPCPPGTFSGATKNQNRSDCRPCTGGSFCAGYGNSKPDGLCAVGFFCPVSDTQQRPPSQRCLAGHACPEGSSSQSACDSGTYQPLPEKGVCLSCPAGYYCDRVEAIRSKASGLNATSHGVTTPVDCPKGYYCPEGTRTANEFPCPRGTYNNETNAESLTQCLPCPPGEYCKDVATVKPHGKCNAGYYCVINATTPSPAGNDSTGAPCPQGSYCPSGAGFHTPCPRGTFGSRSQLQSKSACTPCTGGYYCDIPGLAAPRGPCRAGYFCALLATRPDPYNETFGDICPKGHYCPEKSPNATACRSGFYQPYLGRKNATACLPCRAGKFCAGTGLSTWSGDCDAGFFCSLGASSSAPNDSTGGECPVGSFCPSGSSAPIPCSNGTYTDTTKSAACLVCPAGKFCSTGKSADPCLPGHYCPEGTKNDLRKCPAGTYAPFGNLSRIDQCTQCDAGKYCQHPGASDVTGSCAPGYYCRSGVDVREPSGGHSGDGGICPTGSKCPEGSGEPINCPAGEYSDTLGQAACTPCEKGFYCYANSSSFQENVCPVGHYCPRGTRSPREYPCATGTYNPVNGSNNNTACLSCPPGEYCAGVGLSRPTGKCAEGWYCTGGSNTDRPQPISNLTSECTCPAFNYTGGKCSVGTFCPEGSSYPVDCTSGQYCSSDRLASPSGYCAAGFFCSRGSVRADPPEGLCPAGHFCPNGSAIPTKCDAGSYAPDTGGVSQDDCLPCTPGTYCSKRGLTKPSGNCSAGYYCPEGQQSPTPAGFECTKGHFCSVGSRLPEPCPSGLYQDEDGGIECKLCPTGKYCDNTEANETGCLFRFDTTVGVVIPSVCPSGHYCLNGTSSAFEHPCPTGTFNNRTGLSAVEHCQSCSPGKYCSTKGLSNPTGLCDSGYFCHSGADRPNPRDGVTGDICPAGSFCPAGSTRGTLCPEGTFSNVTGLRQSSQCRQCTPGHNCATKGLTAPTGPCSPGHFCRLGAVKPNPVGESYGDVCTTGHYCIEGTASPEPCSSGTYLPTTGANSSDDCVLCDPGKYCLSPGLNAVTGNCSEGYYCVRGANNSRPRDGQTGDICPVGSFCPEGSAYHIRCLVTTYMDAVGAAVCYACPERFYCPGGEAQIDCPAGSFCPAESGNPQPCPRGTLSTSLNLRNASECGQCSPGSYCDSLGQTNVTGPCDAGYYCESGVDTPTPGILSHLGEGDICPVGHFCPQGSERPLPCEAGTYNNGTGRATCLVCPARYYCLAQAVTYENTPCPAGYYCPAGTKNANQFPCPPGTLNNRTKGGSKEGSCQPCPAGEYCASHALSQSTGKCAPGWYCTGGSASPRPTARNLASNISECSCPALNYTGGRCWPGTFCPEGSAYPLQCTGGSYCSRNELSLPNGLCASGYYCPGGAKQPDPPNTPCPPGSYCPTGSAAPTGCPIGTFSNQTGLTNDSECSACTEGSFCAGVGLTTPTGQCDAKFYCPSGQREATPIDYVCPRGHFCVKGSAIPAPCSPGSYSPSEGASRCVSCPASYYCDPHESSSNTSICIARSDDTFGVYVPALCPPGYYCPNGTEYGQQYPCPNGTFSNQSGLHSEYQCTNCTAGNFCGSTGLTKPTGECSPGYYCDRRAAVPNPLDDITGNVCPPGRFCPAGSSFLGERCPKGTFSNSSGLVTSSQCRACTAGRYCDSEGLTKPSGLCDAGHFCSGGAIESNPVGKSYGDVCYAGHYCPNGTATPHKCPLGTYLNVTGEKSESDCTSCDGGKYCGTKGLTSPTDDCKEGYFCSSRSPTATPVDGVVGNVCPAGFFCVKGSSQPSACLPGTYVNHTKSDRCYACPERFHCVRGFTPDPCPAGYYCGASVGFDYEPCPAGTFSSITGLQNASECQQCLGGRYCADVGQTNVTGLCSPGYYCERGVNTPFPNGGNTGDGAICPVGHYCPEGSSSPIGCPAGTYNNRTGQAKCVDCPSGYYCLQSFVTYLFTVCPTGNYCPTGTKAPGEFPCPPGTFNEYRGAVSESSCSDCPGGKYCGGEGLNAPTGDCSPGWYCTGRANSSKPQPVIDSCNASHCSCPSGNYTGGKCSPGTFCPEGSSFPLLCTPGSYCGDYELSRPSGECVAGYYCSCGNKVPNPGDGICPSGHYCENGTAVPTPCPSGFFSPDFGNTGFSNCRLCTPGSYCGGTGNSLPDGVCDQGYYCPEGQNVSTPNAFVCPLGHFCPSNSSLPLDCPSGAYQDEFGRWQCKACPPGKYCDSVELNGGVVIPSSCPPGSYCPSETATAREHLCPNGTFSNKTDLETVAECVDCSPGFYCGSMGLTEPTGPCAAGFYCKKAAKVLDPTDGFTGDICPVGLYCEAGSSVGVKCPVGTFNNITGLRDESECESCPGGNFCTEKGLSIPSGKCFAGYFCTSRAVLPNPRNESYGDVCPSGSYCPQGTHTPRLCPVGTYLNTTGATKRDQCSACDPGSFCHRLGQVQVSGPCSEGFYCTLAANSSRPIDGGVTGDICPVGHYCEEGSSQPSPCQNGTYMNHTKASECYVCPEGFYCINRVFPVVCPKGFYCPEGTGYDRQKCPTGTFSDAVGLHAEIQCKSCTPGYYCDQLGATSESGLCAEGYYCEEGLDRRVPVGLFKGRGGFCPVGSFCPEGSASPRGCLPGTYNSHTHQANCTQCEPGFYCLINSTTFSDAPCPAGFYCPAGTEFAYQFPCPAGTYNNRTMGQSARDCLLCPPGKYCGEEGLSVPSGLCAPGYYCSRGALAAKPHPTYNDSYATNDFASCPYQPINGTGGICPRGTYCPRGASTPLDCPPGYYCDRSGLEQATGFCHAGFFCAGGDFLPNAVQCSRGHYCPEGTSVEQRCPPGTFSNVTGSRSFNDCIPCTAGYYCEGYAQTEPSGLCSQGYYCPGGQNRSEPLDFVCSTGHFCLEGSGNQTGCPSGTYQDHWGQHNCTECPAGKFCEAFGDYEDLDVPLTNNTGFTGRFKSLRGVVVPSVCPRGSYCPPGTKSATQHLCPLGTYGSKEGLYDESRCTDCPATFYCGIAGGTNVTGICSAGHYCELGASVATPTDNRTGGLCLPGRYCEEGSTLVAKNCPIGTYMDEYGAARAGDCKPCTAGYYCGATGLTTSMGSGRCGAGHYCLQGSSESHPVGESYGDRCPIGHYCRIGTAKPSPCPSGKYLSSVGNDDESDCVSCDEGYYCRRVGSSNVTDECSAGYYCLGGANTSTPTDGITGDICPVGAFCPRGSPTYLDCLNGTFMNHTGASECYVCPAGHYCTERSRALACPRGFYCPEGTGADWRPCPRGTFGASQGLSRSNQCTPCHGGSYCEAAGSDSVTGSCREGFYCTSGVDLISPVQGVSNHRGNGSVCPAGHYCPTGTTFPRKCPAGTYTNVSQQEECVDCIAGFYCPEGTITYENKPCPVGHYCPNGTQSAFQHPCSPGTYNPVEQATDDSACLSCPPGQYCSSPGLSTPSGNCSAGFFCTGGSDTATPLPSVNETISYVSQCSCQEAASPGGKCWPGFYCPEGSSCPTPCSSGSYCEDHGLSSPTGLCDSGYYCDGNASEARPPHRRCPAGFYCPRGTGVPYPCPIGTFSSDVGNIEVSQCLACTPGFYCDGAGLTAPRGECSAGFYCPENQTVPTPPTFKCPKGNRCPNGSAVPLPCPAGEYQPREQASSCRDCPEGYYCDPVELGNNSSRGIIVPIDCPVGYFCPIRTASAREHPCSPGSYGNATNLISLADCLACPAGLYCEGSGLSKPTGNCQAGHLCFSGAKSSTPTDGTTGDICPKGQYCLEGTSSGFDCPPGTYNNKTGLLSVDQCTPCEAGYYCPSFGHQDPYAFCNEGHFCLKGSTESAPINKTYGDLCLAGHYCPVGSAQSLPCQPGTYLPSRGANSSTACLPCSGGHYCGGWGLTEVSGKCAEGYYCLSGAASSTPTDLVTGGICPKGSFCVEGSSFHQFCANGTYTNHSGARECYVCPIGFFCIDGVVPQSCSQGYYCPKGTGFDLVPCPQGTYGNRTGLRSVDQCRDCDGGRACGGIGLTRPSDFCDAGFYCHSGVNVSAPANGVHTGIGGPCDSGHFCPVGTQTPIPCPAGKYSSPGKAECSVCPAGSFCLEMTENPSACPPGYFCPSGTKYSTQYPCRPGYFNNATAAANESEGCKPCPPGSYCDQHGLAQPSGLCDEGFYCSGASSSSRPFVSSSILTIKNVSSTANGTNVTTYSNVTEFSGSACFDKFDCVCPELNKSTGGICPPKFFCPLGSPEPSPCTGGMYCSEYGLAKPTGLCSKGFYCRVSSTPDQYICPPGRYCPQGTEVPIDCPIGTYSPSYGNERLGDCLPCRPGEYCGSTGLNQTSGKCRAGYYCPGNQTVDSPVAFSCPAGHFCVEGSAREVVCPPGTYQSGTGKDRCDVCPAGFYCDYSDGSNSNVDPVVCPHGYYCPNGTGQNWKPCLPGTFGELLGGSSEDDCSPCLPGKFCDAKALTAPSGNCSAGFFCVGGDTTSMPIEDDFLSGSGSGESNDTFRVSGECPIGFYCPEGSSSPTLCPSGKLSLVTRVVDVNGCEDCPPGRFCRVDGSSRLTEAPKCAAGHICTGGSATPTPRNFAEGGYICPAGFFCEEGAIVEEGCHLGSYNPKEKQGSCLSCDPGHLCPEFNMTKPLPCLAGHYCPTGSYLAEPCPRGTFSDAISLSNRSECQSCLLGTYCERTNLTRPEGKCNAGFFCNRRADSPSPSADAYGNGPCVEGHYCPEGTEAPIPCPRGQMRNITGGKSVDDCSPCWSGYFCQLEGMSHPSGFCSPGYYCPEGYGSNTSTPADRLCPKGHKCSLGSVDPMPCEAGYYQDSEGEANCKICPAGYQCPALTINPEPCPKRHYCPEGTGNNPPTCLPGSYANEDRDGRSLPSHCTPCPTSSFCLSGEIAGPCAAGFLCISGNPSPAPDSTFRFSNYTDQFGNVLPNVSLTVNCSADICTSDATTAHPIVGALCPAGSYCPEGTLLPVPCPNDTLNEYEGAQSVFDCGACPAGFECLEGDPIPKPCPHGHYCPRGDTAPIPCPRNRYRNQTAGSNVGDCSPCPAGFFCDDVGIVDYAPYSCPPGRYCPGGEESPFCAGGTMRNETGAAVQDECYFCRPGYYCPHPPLNESHVAGIPCPSKYVCPQGSANFSLCPPGFFCPPVTASPYDCPAGFFCPNGSDFSTPCEYPKYCPNNTAVPLSCGPGYIARNTTSPNRSSKENSCQACPGGTYSNERDGKYCKDCPAGYYCPEALTTPPIDCTVGHYCEALSAFPSPCSNGTHNPSVRSVNDLACRSCAVDTFQPWHGQEFCRPCGSSATTANAVGQTTCQCIGTNRAFQVSNGACICRSGYSYFSEADVEESDTDARDSCLPKVDQLCQAGQFRDAATRLCVSTIDCRERCRNVTSNLDAVELDVTLGRCDCKQSSALSICEGDCPSTKPDLSVVIQSGTLSVEITSTDGGVTHLQLTNSFSSPNVGTTATHVEVVQTADGVGFAGYIARDPVEAEEAFGVESPGRKRRKRATVAASPPRQNTVANPLVCLVEGEAIAFRLYRVNDTHVQYPIYTKDHLLNSNEEFDFGAFTQLADYLKGNVTIETFVHVFNTPGTYVFHDSVDTVQELIVVVLPSSTQCLAENGLRMLSPTSTTLTELSVKKAPVSNTEPNWAIIFGVIGTIAFIVLVLLIAVIVWRPKAIGLAPPRALRPKYRKVDDPKIVYAPGERGAGDDAEYAEMMLGPRGVGVGASTDVTPSSSRLPIPGAENQNEFELENFGVRTLFDKLEDQNLHVKSQLARQQHDLQSFYERMCQQTENLKAMLEGIDLKSLIERRRQTVANLMEDEAFAGTATPAAAAAVGRRRSSVKWMRKGEREEELSAVLQDLLERITSGSLVLGGGEPVHAQMQRTTTKASLNPASSSWKMLDQGELLRRQNAERIQLEQDLLNEEAKAVEVLLKEQVTRIDYARRV